MSGPILEIKNLTKLFPGVAALGNINLQIYPNEIVGLAGENGAGKSTLFNCIAGIHQPNKGEMILKSQSYHPTSYHEAALCGVYMVFQEQGLVPNLNVYENLFLSHEKYFLEFGYFLNKKKMISKATEIFRSLGLDIDPKRVTKSYPFADRQMIEIAKTFTLSYLYNISMPLILLDEPTSALEEDKIEILFSKMKELKSVSSFILISHRLSEVMKMCDRVVVLKDGEIVEVIVPRNNTEEDLHQLMVGREKEADFYKESDQIVLSEASEVVLSINNLCSNKFFDDISFELRKGEILGIGGLVGCGKSELGRAIAGIHSYDKGIIKFRGEDIKKHHSLADSMKIGIGYVPKERKVEGFVGYLPVSWNITLPMVSHMRQFGFPLLQNKLEKRIAKKYIEKFRIKSPSQKTLLARLSGGNQQKVVMAKWIAQGLNVLIVDNPTRGIDVGARDEIYSLLRELVAEGLSIILITDELLELIGLSNRSIILKEGSVAVVRDSPVDDKPTEQEMVSYMV
jgi:ribose transport system ATP-binding protein